IRSLFKEIVALEEEIGRLSEGLETLPHIMISLAGLELQQTNFQLGSKATSEKQNQLNMHAGRASALAVKESILERFADRARQISRELDDLTARDYGLEQWDGKENDDPLLGFRARYSKSILALEKTATEFESMAAAAKIAQEAIVSQRVGVENTSRALRTELESLSEGAGKVAREIAGLKSQAAQLQSRQKLLSERVNRLNDSRGKRDKQLDELERIRFQRFTSRAAAAERPGRGSEIRTVLGVCKGHY
ncbi:hypothetical protein JZU71_02500, partial [bacterium]|nr:hypothetical protein [bacterium]